MCGTPVIAFRRGWVPEVMEDGVTGFIVDDVDEAVAATPRAVDPARRVPGLFEARFPAERMARDYVAIYERLSDADGGSRWPPRGGPPARRSRERSGHDEDAQLERGAPRRRWIW